MAYFMNLSSAAEDVLQFFTDKKLGAFILETGCVRYIDASQLVLFTLGESELDGGLSARSMRNKIKNFVDNLISARSEALAPSSSSPPLQLPATTPATPGLHPVNPFVTPNVQTSPLSTHTPMGLMLDSCQMCCHTFVMLRSQVWIWNIFLSKLFL